MKTYLACFDISDDKARRLVGRRLEHFGTRVQRSVFEVSAKSQNEVDRLQKELLDWIDPEDDVRFYPLCRDCRKKSQDVRGNRVAAYPAAIVV